MSEYLTEEEQVERLKQWWKENGRSIVAGVVIGLGIFGSWKGWQSYELGQAESGSVAFDSFQNLVRENDLPAMLTAEDSLRKTYDGSAYADLASFATARELTNAGRLEDAATRLRAVHVNGTNTAMRELARVHLARVLLAQESYAEAETLLQAEASPAFLGEIELLRGDLARLQNDEAGARAAYERALAADGADREWLELMIQNLSGGSAG